MKTFSFLGLSITNDIDELHEKDVLNKIQDNTHFSFLFIGLLSVSIIVCTLGLLLDNSALVIGGMIISPLNWPLVKISLGITYGQRSYIYQALSLLLFCIVISLLSAIAITYISPIKIISNEILAQTNPTLVDIIAALLVGAVAAFAITQPRISDTLAGVAIATSLMPPLCTTGIGIALQDQTVAINSFILFIANVISIIFITMIIFLIIGIKKHTQSTLQRKGIIFTSIMLIITSIPLFIFLQQYSFKRLAYHTVTQVLKQSLNAISPTIYVENIETRLDSKDKITVDAIVWLSEDIAIDYQQQQAIADRLEQQLQKDVYLNLRLQRTLSIISEQDKKKSILERSLRDELIALVKKTDPNTTIGSITITPEPNSWVIYSVLRTDPHVIFTESHRINVEEQLESSLNIPVTLTIDIIPRLKLQSGSERNKQQLTQSIKEEFASAFPNTNIQDITIQSTSSNSAVIASLSIEAPRNMPFPKKSIDTIQQNLQKKYNKPFIFTLSITDLKILEFK